MLVMIASRDRCQKAAPNVGCRQYTARIL